MDDEMEERWSLIDVGDEIHGHRNGSASRIQSIVKGKNGLLWEGVSYAGTPVRSFLPYELPPSEYISGWYGWKSRSVVTLYDGRCLGSVAFSRSDPRPRTIEEYDAEFDRTIETIRQEEAMGVE